MLWLEGVWDVLCSWPEGARSLKTGSKIHPRGIEVLKEIHAEAEKLEGGDCCSLIACYLQDGVVQLKMGCFKDGLGRTSLDLLQICLKKFPQIIGLISSQ